MHRLIPEETPGELKVGNNRLSPERESLIWLAKGEGGRLKGKLSKRGCTSGKEFSNNRSLKGGVARELTRKRPLDQGKGS